MLISIRNLTATTLSRKMDSKNVSAQISRK